MGRDITQCHPRLQAAATKLIAECARHGIVIKIGECFRTVKEQDELYAQGRTKPGPIVTNAKGSSYSSQHQWGIAFDFYLNMDVDGDGSVSDDAFNDCTGLFTEVGKIAKSIGLSWGGDWTSIQDKPHLYLPDWGSTTGLLKEQFGSLEAFKETWKYDEYSYTDIGTGRKGLTVTASSLIVRTSPNGSDTGNRYKNGDTVVPYEKAISGTEHWFRTELGWISADYLTGWVEESGKWWYLYPGYTYPTGKLEIIDGKCYCFDYVGWMITPNRVKADGEII